jgi:hypothetical protein
VWAQFPEFGPFDLFLLLRAARLSLWRWPVGSTVTGAHTVRRSLLRAPLPPGTRLVSGILAPPHAARERSSTSTLAPLISTRDWILAGRWACVPSLVLHLATSSAESAAQSTATRPIPSQPRLCLLHPNRVSPPWNWALASPSTYSFSARWSVVRASYVSSSLLPQIRAELNYSTQPTS